MLRPIDASPERNLGSPARRDRRIWSRKRVWEIGSLLLLALVLLGAAAGIWSWRQRQAALNAQLLVLLEEPHPIPDERSEAMLRLLKEGADVNLHRTDGWTVLMIAASANHLPLVREALAHGADVNATSERDYTPLMLTSSAETVRLLLEHGADLRRASTEGVTAETLLRESGKPGILRLLAAYKAGRVPSNGAAARLR